MNLKNNFAILQDKVKPVIIHHTNELTLGGTEKLIETNMPFYLTDNTFDHYLAYRSYGDLSREENFKKILPPDRMLSYDNHERFISMVKNIKPFIIHRYAAGIPEFPFIPEIKQHTNHFVSTSTFGDQDKTIEISKVVYISAWVRNNIKDRDNNHVVVTIPVPAPVSETDLREELEIPQDAFVFGRIGRDNDNIYSPLAAQAIALLQKDHKNVYFVAVAPSKKLEGDILKYNVKNFRKIDRTTDAHRISSFFNTIDVMAHSRLDGECNPMSIWESFAHGKPVVSHYGFPFNGHIEIIKDCGFVALYEDVEMYYNLIKKFVNKEFDYEQLSKNCIKNWKENATPRLASSEQLDVYKSLKVGF